MVKERTWQIGCVQDLDVDVDEDRFVYWQGVDILKIHVDFVFAVIEVVDQQYQHQYEGPQVGEIDCFTDCFCRQERIDCCFFLQKFYNICDPAEENEPNTLAVKVTTEMTPHDVMNIILNGNWL